jgi:hypothetical protein
MGLDIRLPIGLMFTILGGLLTCYGLFSDREIYQKHSLGINVNLEWGLVVLAFGILMLIMGRRGAAALKTGARAAQDQAGGSQAGVRPRGH